jgi:hypothetical protein
MGLSQAPLQWIMIGCIIPDLPWISQRIVNSLSLSNPLDLRLYSVTQASLLYCLLLSLALALLTSKSIQIFSILAGNSLLHLLLDACQNKWGNGVNLLAPFSWKSLHFNLFWPEHVSSYIFASLGLFIFLFLWPKSLNNELFIKKPGRKKALACISCLILYFASPVLLIQTAYSADIHYSKTLNNRENRIGKMLEIDRGHYDAMTKKLSCYMDTGLNLTNIVPLETGIVSIQGRFITPTTIAVEKLHVHKIFRDLASYAGLTLTLLFWIHTLVHQKGCHPPHHRNL